MAKITRAPVERITVRVETSHVFRHLSSSNIVRATAHGISSVVLGLEGRELVMVDAALLADGGLAGVLLAILVISRAPHAAFLLLLDDSLPRLSNVGVYHEAVDAQLLFTGH